MVTAGYVGLCPSNPHHAGLEVLKKALDIWENKKISTDDLTKMTKFILKNNYFEFKFKKQISGTAIGIQLASPYQSVFINQVET